MNISVWIIQDGPLFFAFPILSTVQRDIRKGQRRSAAALNSNSKYLFPIFKYQRAYLVYNARSHRDYKIIWPRFIFQETGYLLKSVK